MKFTIDGREYEDYQLSNEQMVSLIKNDTKACSDDRDWKVSKSGKLTRCQDVSKSKSVKIDF